MKKLLYIAITFMAVQSYSQKTLSTDYSFKPSGPYRVYDAKEKYYFAHNGEAIAIKLDERDVNLQKFNTDKPAFIKETKYEDYFPKHYILESVNEIDSRYYVFFSSWDGDNDKEQLYAAEVDFDKAEFIGQPKLVFAVNGHLSGVSMGDGVNYAFWGFGMTGVPKFSIISSHDHKNILVQYRKKPEVKRDTKSFDIIGLNAYDGGLTNLSSREITMPYTERRMDNLDYQLDNRGNLYLLTKVFHDDSNDDKKHRNDVVANYHLELFFLKSGSDKIAISKFENKDKFINKLWLFDTPKDFLICGGFYSNGKGHFDDSDGIATFKVKEDGSIYDANFQEIPLDVINANESAKTVRKNERKERKKDEAQFADLKLKNVIVQDDGSIIVAGEQDYVVSHTSGGMNGSSHTYYTYHYCDILVTKIGPDGKFAWMKKIPKNQMGMRGKGGMSYKYFYANNNNYFIFLDNVKNIDLPIDKEPKRHSDGQGGYLTAVKIANSDGSLTKGSILNARDVDDFGIYQFSTDRVFKTGENSFLFEAYKKKKEDVMVKVTLN